MIRFFEKSELREKILSSNILILIFSFLLLGISINVFFSGVLDRSAGEKTVQAISQANHSIDNYINEAQRFAALIARDNDVQQFLEWSGMNGTPEELQTKSNVRNLLTDMVQVFPHMRGIAIVNNNDLFLSNEMYRQSPASFLNESWYRESIQNIGAAKIIKKQDSRILSYYESVPVDNVVSIVTAVNTDSSKLPVGVVIIDVDMGFIQDVVNATVLGPDGFLYIMDEDGQIVYAPPTKIIPRIKAQWFGDSQGVMNRRVLGQNLQFVYYASQITKWKTVGVVSLQQARTSISQFQFFLFFMLAVSVGLALLLTAIVAISLARPALQLNTLMESVQSGNLGVRYEGDQSDEIGRLGGVFNNMIEKISELLALVKREQQQKRQAELLVLREQIKPHFLYNTLDSIQWLAYKRQAPEIMEMVTALSTLFRIGLSGGREIITVGDEMAHALSYLTIQKIRYREKLQFNTTCDLAAERIYVQKIILQPLIENAIYHGIKNRDGPGFIAVNAYLEGSTVVMEVYDDAGGIGQERLVELNRELSSDDRKSPGYGLFNTNERIRLSYGAEYGVRLFGKEGQYTVAVITHPVITGVAEIGEEEE